MKNLFYILLFLTSGAIVSQTKGKVTYLATMNKDSIKKPTEDIKDQAKYDALQLIHGSHPVETYLVFNDSIALYSVEPKIEIPGWNTTDGQITISKANLNLTWIFAGGESLYYTDWSRDWNISQKDVYFERKRIKHEEKRWELTKETKEILGYVCYKAVSEDSKLKVWYAPELNVKHGPQGINGLPGLVLEAKRNRFLIKATNIDLENNEYEIIEEPVEGELMQEAEYRKLGKAIFSKE